MRTVTIGEARARLSRLVDEAARGDVVVITRCGRPLVKLAPDAADETAAGRRIGFMAGEITVPDDFDDMGRAAAADLLEGGGRSDETSKHRPIR